MGENSAIEWTDHTFNPWIGCEKVADGCTHCYAEAYAKRYGRAVWGPHGTRVKTSADYWRNPIKWNREAANYHASHLGPTPRPRVFCASLADVFEDWDGPIQGGGRDDGTLAIDDNRSRLLTMDDLRRDLFALIDATPWLDWLLLTKRPENIRRMWPRIGADVANVDALLFNHFRPHEHADYRQNVWLLTSVATQADADKNVPELLKCRDLVPVLGLSCEPLLESLALSSQLSALDWLIVGGESGHGARPMHPDWARSLRDQCIAAGVPFFFKQWGEWLEVDGPRCRAIDQTPRERFWFTQAGELVRYQDGYTRFGVYGTSLIARVGKKAAGRLLDGREWNEFPTTEGVDVAPLNH